MTLVPKPIALQNRLLALLPKTAFKRLLPQLEQIHLERDDLLYEARAAIEYAYFPVHGVLSALAVMPAGACIEVGTIGREGGAGVFGSVGRSWSPNRVVAQGTGESLRIKSVHLQKAADADAGLRDLLMRYHSYSLTQMSQSVACNGLHQIPQRCCRWLLMTHDRAGKHEFDLTHEYLAMMLGVRRPGVTEVLQRLKEQGMIDYSRGSIKIVNRKALEAACCDCYAIVEKEYARLLGARAVK